MSIKLNDEIIHDNEAIREVFFNAKAMLKIFSKNLDMAIEDEYSIRGGKFLKGQDYKNEIKRMKVELETLTELFSGENCKRYHQEAGELEDELEDEYEMEI